MIYFLSLLLSSRVILREDHIPERPDKSLLISRQTSKWSLRDMVFQENNSNTTLEVFLFSDIQIKKIKKQIMNYET